jgi:hypothetical protein
MSPDDALRQIRALVEAMASEDCTADHRALLAVDLAAAWEGLDRWIQLGGFLPSDWQQAQVRALP